MSVNYAPNVVRNGLVLYLDAANTKSYPGSGTTWTDLSGTGNNATLLNGPVFSGTDGGAIVFDGTNDSAYTASSSSFAFGTGDFTLDVWIKPESFTSYTHMLALPDQGTFVLKATRTGDGVAGTIYVYTPTFTTFGSTNGWTLTLNTWQNVSFKRESSVAYAFLNGNLIGSKSGFTNSFSSQALNIHAGYAAEYTQCRMSNIKIYNTALTNTQIKQNFNATRSRYGL